VKNYALSVLLLLALPSFATIQQRTGQSPVSHFNSAGSTSCAAQFGVTPTASVVSMVGDSSRPENQTLISQPIHSPSYLHRDDAATQPKPDSVVRGSLTALELVQCSEHGCPRLRKLGAN
jgi:hypothetical protein